MTILYNLIWWTCAIFLGVIATIWLAIVLWVLFLGYRKLARNHPILVMHLIRYSAVAGVILLGLAGLRSIL